MKRLCFNKIFFILFLLIGPLYAKSAPNSVILYYGDNPPKEIFRIFDWVVVEPKNIKNISKYKKEAKVFAYISLEEAQFDDKVNKKWVIGKNRDWNSYILDIRDKNYQNYLFKKLKSLEKYDGFMFDTLDSYQIVLKNQKEKKEYEKALSYFINQCKKRFPNKLIIINRGFEIYHNIKNSIDALLVESLYSGVDTKTMEIKKVAKEDRNWLLAKLNQIKKEKPVIVVDYLNPPFKEGEKIAKKISFYGFIPYISNIQLDNIGISNIKYIPRKVLILYYSDLPKNETEAHSLFSMPLEYMGFIPKLWNIKKKGLPKENIFDRYAGVIVAFEQNRVENEKEWFNWIYKNIKKEVKFLFINGFGFENDKYFEKLGLSKVNNINKNHSLVLDKIANFETIPLLQDTEYLLYSKEIKNIVGVKANKKILSAAAITKWGGFALPGSATYTAFSNNLWVIDPFVFFKNSLKLPDIPVLDTTTENGRRILFIHIDGDGFMEKAYFKNQKFSAEVLYDEILKKYKIPHSISVIEGEISPNGLYPKDSHKLLNIAKMIYKLPYIEPASHSFTHPFKWSRMENKEEGYNLPIKNYEFDLKREILDSIKFVDSLLPKGKKTKLFFWTGDCLPSKKALKLCYENNILNINGGDTTITDENPWLSYISPLGLYRGEYFQVYAAVQNENVFTDDWKNFGGYIKVIETFKKTESPKRIKPINIYYHFYSASKKASLNALKRVYEWALKQKITPMYASMWIKRVLDYENSVIAKKDNGWIIVTDKNIKTIRYAKKPDLIQSKNIIGYYKKHNNFYIHLNNKGKYTLFFNENKNNKPYIVNSNAILINEEKNYFKFKSYLPIEISFYLPKKCSYKIIPQFGYKKDKSNEIINIKYKNSKEVKIEFSCK